MSVNRIKSYHVRKSYQVSVCVCVLLYVLCVCPGLATSILIYILYAYFNYFSFLMDYEFMKFYL